MIVRWSSRCNLLNSVRLRHSPLSLSMRYALTDAQAAILDHSLRQLLHTSPCLITQITRGLPDTAVDILDDLDGSLLDYLKRNRKFVVRQTSLDNKVGGANANLVSLAPSEAVTTIHGDARKIAIVVHDIIASSATAHLVGQGMAISKIFDLLNTGQRKQLCKVGTLNVLAQSYENVFELSADGKYVRLVDERTPVRPSETFNAINSASQSSAAAAAAARKSSNSNNNNNVSAVPIAPAAPQSNALPSTHSRTSSHRNPAAVAATAMNVPLSDKIVAIVNVLVASVPFDSYITLDELLQHAPTRIRFEQMLSVDTNNVPHSVVDHPLHTKIVRLLESVPSTALDCRIFDEHNPRMIFLRVIGNLKDATLNCRPDIEVGDPLELRKSALPHTWILLEAILKKYEAALGVEEINTWFRNSFSTTIAAPTGTQLQLLLTSSAALSSTLTQPSPQSVEQLPPLELNSLCMLCAQLDALISDIPQLAPARSTLSVSSGGGEGGGGNCVDDSYRPFALLICDRLPHLFDVNWPTYEVRIRREIMAAWWALKTSPPVVGVAPPSSLSSLSEDEQQQSSPVEVSLKSVLQLVMASPQLRTLSNSTLDTSTTPVQRALRQTRSVSSRSSTNTSKILSGGATTAAVFCPTTLTIDNLRGNLFPSAVADSVISVFGSIETFARYHSSEFFIRTSAGTPLSAPLPPDVDPRNSNNDAATGGVCEDDKHRFIWSADQVVSKRSHEVEQHIAESVKDDNILPRDVGGLHKSSKAALSWSDNTVAQVLFNTLPSLEEDHPVLWRKHLRYLQNTYTTTIPHHVLHRNYSTQFFFDRPHLFEVFELIHGSGGGRFLVARRGTTPPPFGIHPKHCRTLEEAIKQLAVVSVGGVTLEESMNSLSSEARTLVKRYGGSEEIALALPMWFEVRASLITYIGGQDNNNASSGSTTLAAAMDDD
ncbi:Hypothetical protein, putative [Bodo saltans]|uniref:Uncharacterized protein n=1 Tax=Bodo saltans TaxID=75058 RepID=A0A0S4JN76_BODSA|nr:Hypothetical protein, putative [Bodo saltans]|eukprot:CUG92945.1 Hypothetical protein, putative [Bodo saltans]